MVKYKVIIAIIFLSLFACNTRDYNELYGKWYFVDKDGSYGEFWIDSDYALTIDEHSYDARVYEYELENDTITLLNFNVAPRYSFYVKSLGKDKMVISDPYRDYDCYKITSTIKIDTSSAYEDSVYEEFGPRFQKGSTFKD